MTEGQPITYIGIDPAENTGFAYYFPFSHEAHLFECLGDPIRQWEFLKNLIFNCPTSQVCIEMPTHFRNAVTTRDLVGRYGYLKWNSLLLGYPMLEIRVSSVRHLLGTKTKLETKHLFQRDYRGPGKITDNHTDALAVAMYAAYLGGHQRQFFENGLTVVPDIKVIT